VKNFRYIWFIAVKDLKLFVTDRMALFFFILFPFLFVALFSFILSDVGSEDERLELHLVTQEDRGGLSHRIAEAIETGDESDLDAGEPLIIWDEDYEDALQTVTGGKSGGFLAFPEDFTEGISLGYGTNIEVVADPEATYDRAALNSIAEAIAYQVGLQSPTRLVYNKWLGTPSPV